MNRRSIESRMFDYFNGISLNSLVKENPEEYLDFWKSSIKLSINNEGDFFLNGSIHRKQTRALSQKA